MTMKACIFDVFGTLVDWREGIAQLARPVLAEFGVALDGHELAMAWRAEYQPGMDRVRSGGRAYTPLHILHRENLKVVLGRYGIDLPDPALDTLNAGWSALPAWPEVPDALRRIRDQHWVAPCSNGSIPIMAGIARKNGLVWDCIAGAPLARDFKPRPQVYRESVAAFGLEPHEVMMVAAHNDDLAAAREEGLATGFFPRITEYGPDQTTDLHPEQDWDIIAEDLADLARTLSD